MSKIFLFLLIHHGGELPGKLPGITALDPDPVCAGDPFDPQFVLHPD
jgi:hypothetical protein